MSIRNATIGTAVILGFGLNAAAIKEAAAGDNCSRPEGILNSQWQPTPSRPMQAAMYWGAEPARVFKTGMSSMAETAPAGDIVDVAVGAGGFETLVAVIQAAGLAETLKGDGPFTVFAPTDAAFAEIPAETLEALLADKEALTAVLTYHVVPGRVMAADVVNLSSAKTVQGGSIAIDTTDGVKVDSAKVIKTDIVASNGVIHVIDSVIMPN